ncbi:MAG: adenylosuccinate lyase [Candidatus Dadabacteria bacterium]|nr:MAG: adenylosuccinate lyase [Candidatus Dadabacteria bacterium]
MIKRYSREEFAKIWEQKLLVWLQVEKSVISVLSEEGYIPLEAAKAILKVKEISEEKVLEREKQTRHDVIAFVEEFAAQVGEEGRYVHWGMTSSDLLDTSFSLILKEAGEKILSALSTFQEAVLQRSLEHKHTICLGRTHGIYAEPITFGLKLLSWYAELKRAEKRIKEALNEISFGKLSGAVGTFSLLPPTIEEKVMSKLYIRAEPIASQVIPRDRYAAFFLSLAILASSLERFALEIRHLQRSEVQEVYEPFFKGQKGSSAMPHKKNPILCENICGLARLVRNLAHSSLENIALWHERDISHSSVERVIAPDITILIDFMLHRFTSIVKGLVVNVNKMEENLRKSKGVVFSSKLLFELIKAGLSRADAYRLLQEASFRAQDKNKDLKEEILESKEVVKLLGKEKINEIFSFSSSLKYVDYIFKRVLNEYKDF